LPAVLYGCETWSVTLRQLILRVFGNRVLRRNDVTGVEKTASKTASCSVFLTRYNTGDQIKKNMVDGACSMYGGRERCMQGFVGET
jgi:hypothetical protein